MITSIIPTVVLLGKKSNGWNATAKIIVSVWLVAMDIAIVVLATN